MKRGRKRQSFSSLQKTNLIAHFKYFQVLYLLSTTNVKCTFKCDFEVILYCQEHSILSLQNVNCMSRTVTPEPSAVNWLPRSASPEY